MANRHSQHRPALLFIWAVAFLALAALVSWVRGLLSETARLRTATTYAGPTEAAISATPPAPVPRARGPPQKWSLFENESSVGVSVARDADGRAAGCVRKTLT